MVSIKDFYCDIYGCNICVAYGGSPKEIKNYIQKRFYVDLNINDFNIGGVWTLCIDDNRYYLIWIMNTKDIFTMFHECFHLVFKIFTDREINIDFNNQEPFAYYMEAWSKRIWQIMNPSKPKKKNTKTN